MNLLWCSHENSGDAHLYGWWSTAQSETAQQLCTCVCVSASHLINVAQPFADVLEALGVGDVIDQHDAHGSSVVGGGNGVEPFLARCVPAQPHIQRTDFQTRISAEAPIFHRKNDTADHKA